jgi:ketosteroid isomerase-like protein
LKAIREPKKHNSEFDPNFAGLKRRRRRLLRACRPTNVDWTVMGTHLLVGHYRSKRSFKEDTFSKLGKVLPDGAQLRVTNVIIAGDMAVVQLVSDASARNGMRFDNHYCWVTRFHRIFFGGAYLEVDGERFDANGIRQLYESDTYPLGRRA